MRQIHPTGFHEKFVASGVYTDLYEGEPTGNLEHWSIHELPDGSWKVRVDWETHEDFWVDLIEALIGPEHAGRRIERFDISAYATDQRVARVEASYIFFEGYAEVGRTYNDEPRQQEEVSLPSEYVIYPGTRLFQGFAVAQAAQKNGAEITVVSCSPLIGDDSAFRPMFTNWSVNRTAQEVLEIAGQSYVAQRYEQRVPAGHLNFYWLDEHDILLKAETLSRNQRQYRSILTQYARRPEPSNNP